MDRLHMIGKERDVTVHDYLLPGSPGYGRATAALTFVGIITFFNLHMMQPLLPLFSLEFSIEPVMASLLMSLPVLAMVFFLLIFGPLSDMSGRKWLIATGLSMVSCTTIYTIFAQSFSELLMARIGLGVFLGALPSVAMAYLSEEFIKEHLAGTMAIYIAGTAFGGMAGRMISGWIATHYSWQSVFVATTFFNVLTLACFVALLPPSRHFQKKKHNVREELQQMGAHLKNPVLLYDFLVAMVLHYCFYGIYTYLGFRLHQAPFDLSIAEIGYIYLVYITGIIFSPFFGRWAAAIGLLNLIRISAACCIIGILLTISSSMTWIIIGLLLYTGGHFSAHSAGSSWISKKADEGKGAATSLYLVAYYSGGSLGAFSLGLFWDKWGWIGVAGVTTCLFSAILYLCYLLHHAEKKGEYRLKGSKSTCEVMK